MEKNFNKLLENIKLTDLQKEDASTKVQGVCEALQEKYYPTISYNGSTKLLIGSYGKHTNIRPPRDIDLLFKMPVEEFQRFDALAGNKQSQLLQEVRGVLKDKFSTTEEIRAFGKVIVIGFSEGTHTVELLPAWLLTSGSYRIPNSENGGSWDTWNPVAEIENISKSNQATGCTCSLIRMIKCWVRVCSTPLKSFVVEILVINYLQEKYGNNVASSYSDLVSGFFEYLKAQKNSIITSPANSSVINLGEEWYSRADSAHARAQKAISLENEGKLHDASLEWRKVFGDDFPVAEDKVFDDSLAVKIGELTKMYPSTKEEDITKKYGHEYDFRSRYMATVDATISYKKGYRPGSLKSYVARKIYLLKGDKLLFRVTTTVPSPYSVMWKVRNFGDEACSVDGLRGEITYDAGRQEKEEHTKYHGDHYVECYIIKDGLCVALGRILVPIGKNYE